MSAPAQLRAELETRIRPFKRVKHIRLQGLMGAVELDTSDDPKFARRTCAAMIKRGVLSRSMGPVVTIVPPLTITAAEIERIVATLAAALEKQRDSLEFLGRARSWRACAPSTDIARR